MRTAGWMMVIAGWATPLAMGQSGAAPSAAAPAPAPAAVASTDPRAVTMRQLARPVTLELTEARMEDAIQFLRDFSGASIDVFWNDDGGAGLDKDKQVSITTRETPVLAVIERLLRKSGDEFESASWQFTDDGGIEIGPKSRLNESKTLKVYDIQDLLFVIPDFSDVPELDIDSVLQNSQGGGGGSSIIRDSQGQQPGQGGPQQSDEESAQKIIDLIIENIEPEQWQDNGGDGASVRFYNGTLLIRAADYIHRQIEPEAFMRARSSRAAAAGGGRAITNATPGAVEPQRRETAQEQTPAATPKGE